jgi:hypothetical protein
MAVMDEGARMPVSRMRLAMGASSAVYLLCTLLMAVAIALVFYTGEMLFLALPLPFLAPVLPSLVESFRLAASPAPAMQLEAGGIRVGNDVLPYENIQWAELDGPATRPRVRFICTPNAHPPFRALPFEKTACRIPGAYDARHLDFVQEINLRIRMAGNPGIR